ncbi:MAG TPA: PIG-L family deacetylase [Verrucomicrobiae bacterium]|nr:PIG-L family deacetylase [Verrucomicrobiae bacterium]
MKQLLFGVFAHPDDEAFGPSATLMKWASQGTDVHLLCLTDGQAGMNPDNVPDLGKTRATEWHTAGKAMGAASLHRFGYQDGSLNNNLYHEIADKINATITQVAAEYNEPLTINFMCFDENGLTGHLDHIAATRIASYVFYRLKAEPLPNVTMDSIYYYCLSKARQPEVSTGYVFMNEGRDTNDVTHIEDVRDWVEKKFEIMRLHHSQRSDAQDAMKLGPAMHEEDYFYVRS